MLRVVLATAPGMGLFADREARGGTCDAAWTCSTVFTSVADDRVATTSAIAARSSALCSPLTGAALVAKSAAIVSSRSACQDSR